ncbi:GNAT family N-acetyltransferase [Arthrobacter sp. 35W]|uniref:GNAT family N-acetyltransferase n=1 Tax=Arthrobacter sp. 35W TaxID=1132441 RepID=UPI0003FD6CE0|nr:GNAT family protein [Arthrobacter sp. 35W]
MGSERVSAAEAGLSGDILATEVVVPVLTDGVVSLRALRPEDGPTLVFYCRDPESVRWTTIPRDYTAADAEAFISDMVPTGWASGKVLAFAVASASTDELLGTIDLQCSKPGSAEVGINVGHPHRGSGVGARAVDLLVDYAFNQQNLAYLHWLALVPNWGSRKLAWKIGFRLEGTLRGYADDRGTPTDAWMFTLSAQDPRGPQEPWQGPTPASG